MSCRDSESGAHGLSTVVAQRGGSDAREARAAARLDLHEGIDDPLRNGCQRWPEQLRLLNHSTGELVPGRCRATNLCRYCQTLYVVETVEMLTLDAMEYAPTLWGVLTAREHLTRAECRRHLDQLKKKLRRRWPEVEWFVQVEFQRRGALHLNLLFKGVPIDDVDELRQVAVQLWCSRVDALPVGQWFGVVEDGVGVVRYLSKMLAHGLKKEQAPPIGWRGHRTSQTRGYLVRPASAMRTEARRALSLKRKLHRGLSLEVALHELERDAEIEWSLRHVQPSSALGDARLVNRAVHGTAGSTGNPDPPQGRDQLQPAIDSAAALTALLPAEGNDPSSRTHDDEHEAPAHGRGRGEGRVASGAGPTPVGRAAAAAPHGSTDP